MSKINIVDLGFIDYYKSLKIQEKYFNKLSEGKIENTLLFAEHPPVITLGISGKKSNIILNDFILEEKNIKVYEVKRGGDVTYHGPGQLVGYFIFDLRKYYKDVRKFVYNIEQILINFLKRLFDITAKRDSKKYTGVWVDNCKIAAIGIQVKRYITMHGFAFNVNTDLSHFDWIIPCGIIDKKVTSLEKITGERFDLSLIKNELKKEINDIF